jgi:hypothetical protein
MSNRPYALEPGDIARLLPKYRQWMAEGKPPYMHASFDKPPRKPQFYYDSYHDSIRENDDGTFRFDIQTFDSPEGDTWVRGKFKLDGEKITILEQHAYAN